MKKSHIKNICLSISCLMAVGGAISAFAYNNSETIRVDASGSLTGSGTADDPYKIGDKGALEKFRDIVNGSNGETQNDSAYAILTNSFDAGYSESNQWVPFSRYKGVFDGQDYKISGLCMNTNNTNAAFVLVLDSSGEINNLTVGGSFKATDSNNSSAGGFASINFGRITRCTNEATITGACSVGGIAGKNWNYIGSCANKGQVISTSSSSDQYNACGGIVGYMSVYGNDYPASRVENSYNLGSITVGRVAGGIVGYPRSNYSKNVAVKNSFNMGALGSGGSANYKGAIAGNNYNSNYSDNYYLDTSYTAAVKGGTKSGCTSLTIDQFKVQSNFSNWDFANIWRLNENDDYPVLRLPLTEAKQFASLFIEQTGTICSSGGESADHSEALSNIWSTLNTAWNGLSSGAKTILNDGGSEGADATIADFYERYCHIVDRYGDDFAFSGGPVVQNAGNRIFNNSIAENDGSIIVIVTISVSSAIALVGLCFLKRKRSRS